MRNVITKTKVDILWPKGLERNLAKLAIKTSEKSSNETSDKTSKLATIKLWHERLAHIGITPLQKILKQIDLYISKDEISRYIEDICEICLLSKYNRSINKRSYTTTEYKVGERIHSDLGGPINPKTYDGHSYYITFLDKKSRYLYIKLIKSKAEVLAGKSE